MKVTLQWEKDEDEEFLAELDTRIGFRLAKKDNGQFVEMSVDEGEMISKALSGLRGADLPLEVMSVATLNGPEFVLVPEWTQDWPESEVAEETA